MKFSSVNINYSSTDIYNIYTPIVEHEEFIKFFSKVDNKNIILQGVYGAGKSFVTSLIVDSLLKNIDIRKYYKNIVLDTNYEKLILNGNYYDLKNTYKELLSKKFEIEGETIEDILKKIDEKNLENNKKFILVHDEFGRIFENLDENSISYTMQFLQDFAEFITHQTKTIKTLFIVHKSLNTYFKEKIHVNDFKRVEKRYRTFVLQTSIDSFKDIIKNKNIDINHKLLELSYAMSKEFGQDSRTLFHWLDSDSKYSLSKINKITEYQFEHLFYYYKNELSDSFELNLLNSELSHFQKEVLTVIYLWNISKLSISQPLDKSLLKIILDKPVSKQLIKLSEKGFIRFNELKKNFELFESLGIDYNIYLPTINKIIDIDLMQKIFSEVFEFDTYIFNSLLEEHNKIEYRDFTCNLDLFENNKNKYIYIDLNDNVLNYLSQIYKFEKLKNHHEILKFGHKATKELDYFIQINILILKERFYKKVKAQAKKLVKNKLMELNNKYKMVKYKFPQINNIQLIDNLVSKRFYDLNTNIQIELLNANFNTINLQKTKRNAEFKLFYYSLFNKYTALINNDEINYKSDLFNFIENKLIFNKFTNIMELLEELEFKTTLNTIVLKTFICLVFAKNREYLQLTNKDYIWLTINKKSINDVFNHQTSIQKINLSEELIDFHKNIFNSKLISLQERKILMEQKQVNSLSNIARTFIHLLNSLPNASKIIVNSKFIAEDQIELVSLLKRIEVDYTTVDIISKKFATTFEKVYNELLDLPSKILKQIGISEFDLYSRLQIEKENLTDPIIEILLNEHNFDNWNGIKINTKLSNKGEQLLERLEILISAMGKSISDTEKNAILIKLLKK